MGHFGDESFQAIDCIGTDNRLIIYIYIMFVSCRQHIMFMIL